MTDTYDRLLASCLREVEREVVQLVERAFERVPLDARELPVIGGGPFSHYGRTVQKELVVAALIAKQWFEFEGPRWARPLLLKAEDCHEMFNGVHRGNPRSWLRGEYGLLMRRMHWHYERVAPFEIFCIEQLAPG